jgi:hypothetical protein
MSTWSSNFNPFQDDSHIANDMPEFVSNCLRY